jgi:antitoxin (DNA-binding transcriptional repressor) of toxin-antitoxin stability system
MMKASVVDLRYRMNEILKAIDRNEEVTVLYHGKVKGVIKPNISGGHKRISDHPFFNMYQSKKTVNQVMADLRGDRYRAV